MKPVTAINLDCIPEKEYLSPEFQLGPISESGGVFIYESSNPAVFTVDQDGVVTITGPGRAYVIIRQLESDDFAGNQIDRLIIVNKSKPPITFLGPETILLTEPSLSTEILKIETVVELIRNVFSTDENILQIIEILPNEYRLIPISIGKASITVLTKSNYYFDSSFAHFDIEILENSESLFDKPLLLNIKVFGQNFKHNALKDIDILTSNKSLKIKDNNLQLSFQQQTRGYTYDVPILNLAADKFVNNVATYNREILCCTPTGNLNFSVNWDFGNNLIFDYFPYEGNVNDIPRINFFRSDGKYIEYMSGGFNFLKIPPNSSTGSPNVYTYQKWGNRNAGTRKFTVPDVGCLNFDNILGLYYGVDLFTTEELRPIVLDPPSGQWSITNTAFGDLKYQYLFTGNNQKDVQIVLPPFVAPNPPEGLIASDIILNSFTVSWNPSPKAITYRLDVSTLSDFSTFEQGFENLTVNGTSQSITGLIAGTVYYIRVRAVNTAGISASSSTLQQETLSLKVAAPNISETGLTVVWNVVPNTFDYRLDVSTSSDFSTFVEGFEDLLVSNLSSLFIYGLAPGTVYYLRIKYTDGFGAIVISNTFVFATAPLAPEITAMTNIVLTDGAGNNVTSPRNRNFLESVFSISWTARTGAQSYRLDVARDEGFTDFVVGYNNKFVSGTTNLVTPGDNPDYGPYVYFARVRATNTQTANPVTSINSTVYSQSSLVRGPSPITPTNATENSVTLNWPEIPNASNYFIDLAMDSSFGPTYVFTRNEVVNGTGYIFTESELRKPPITYWARVRANNSDYGSIRSFNVAPSTPSGVFVFNSTSTTLGYFVSNGVRPEVDISTNSGFNTFTGMNMRQSWGDSFGGLSPITEYYLRARSTYFGTTSLYTPVSGPFLTSPVEPAAPILSLVPNSSQILVSWNPSPGATSYIVNSEYGGAVTTGTSAVIGSTPVYDSLVSVSVAAVNSSYSSPRYSQVSKIRTRIRPVRTLSLQYSPKGAQYYPIGVGGRFSGAVPFRKPNSVDMIRWRWNFIPRDGQLGARATRYAYQKSRNINFSDNPPIRYVFINYGPGAPIGDRGMGGFVDYVVIVEPEGSPGRPVWDLGIPLEAGDLGIPLYFRLYPVSPEGVLGVPTTASQQISL